jgi:hypothetical protein
MAELPPFPRFRGLPVNNVAPKRGGTALPTREASPPNCGPGAEQRFGRFLAGAGATLLVLAAVSLCFLLPRSPAAELPTW